MTTSLAFSVSELNAFVRESNRIERIHRVSAADRAAHRQLLLLPQLTSSDMELFVSRICPGIEMRDRVGLNVRVGSHIPPPGAPGIRKNLDVLLKRAMADIENPWHIHCAYENLHPFMDGNGRSGRALWLWMMVRRHGRMPPLGFLHTAYYQALQAHSSRRFVPKRPT